MDNLHQNPLIVLPTGGGKTVVATGIVEKLSPKRVLFVAHRTELISQAARTFKTGNVIAATIPAKPDQSNVICASLDTLIARKQWPAVDYIVVDEAHHGPAKKWSQLKDRYAQCPIIGLTATPVRSDGKPLGDVFGTIVESANGTVDALTAAGYLVPCEVWAPQYTQTGLAEDPSELYLSRELYNQKTVVFVDKITSAERFRNTLQSHGYSCALITGKMASNERANVLGAYRRGVLRCVVNVGVLTEGWDDPDVTDLILARSCQSLGLYLQIVGRVLRPAQGKTMARLWDLTGACRVHGLPGSRYEYSLEGEPIKCADKADAIKQCLQCGRAYINKSICPVCKTKLGASRAEIKIKRAEIMRVAKEQFESADPEQKLDIIEKYHANMKQIAERSNYKDGWVWNRMLARFKGYETAIRIVMEKN